MTKETKDGFVIHDKRFWVEDEDRTEEESAAPPPQPSIDAETLRGALADLEEAKNRVRRDAERQIERMRAEVLESLLPVLDNLERSIAAATTAPSIESLVNGVK